MTNHFTEFRRLPIRPRPYFLVLLFAIWLWAPVLTAQSLPDGITAHPLPENEVVSDRLSRLSLQPPLVYVDQLEGEIPLDRVPSYRAPRERDENPPWSIGGDSMTALNQVLLLLIAGFLAFLLWRFGRPMMDRMAGPKVLRRENGTDAGENIEVPAVPESELIARLRRMEDKEAALVELVEAILPIAAIQNGMRLGRAETARELLRRLPRTWRHLPNLRRIVMAEELVQFGGRPLEARTFDDCIDRARPILGGEQG